MVDGWSFNPPPHWPRPPRGWVPPPSWEPDPEWGPVPPGWQLWVPTPASRHPWPGMLCATGAVVLTLAAMVWLPRVSDAALVSGDLSGADLVSPAMGSAPVGTLTPAPRKMVAVVPTLAAPTGTPLTQAAAPRFKSCDALTEVYPHGVGMPDAVDVPGPYVNVRRAAVASGQEPPEPDPEISPVTDFGRSTALYGANEALDTDRDRIACER